MWKYSLPFLLLLIIGLFWFLFPSKTTILRIGGGPAGGTFILFSEGMADLLRQNGFGQDVDVSSSGGSVANLRAVEAGRVDFALVYSGDAYLGRTGLLKDEPARYTSVRALCRLYGSAAQLAVSKSGVIDSIEDLVGRRIAIGSHGSGSAHSAERYFSTLGMWDVMTPLYMGYDLGMRELLGGRAEAVWQLVGAPSASITEINRRYPLRLLELAEYGRDSDFFRDYPFYTEKVIPEGTYDGQVEAVASFQDNTLLVANVATPPELVDLVLKALFSPAGKQKLVSFHPVARELDVKTALHGIEIPLHPAAERLWKQRGLLQ